MKVLIKFLCSITKQLKQSKSGSGINCYDIEAITKHKAKVERLCNTCGWRLSHFASKDEYDKSGKKIASQESYYLGPQTVDTQEDLLEAFTQ